MYTLDSYLAVANIFGIEMPHSYVKSLEWQLTVLKGCGLRG